MGTGDWRLYCRQGPVCMRDGFENLMGGLSSRDRAWRGSWSCPELCTPKAPTSSASITAEQVLAYMAAENTNFGHRSWSAGLLEPRPLQSSQGPSSDLHRVWWQRKCELVGGFALPGSPTWAGAGPSMCLDADLEKIQRTRCTKGPGWPMAFYSRLCAPHTHFSPWQRDRKF